MKSAKRGRPLVYICSRFSGDTEVNAEKAREYSRFSADKGLCRLRFPQFVDEEAERQSDILTSSAEKR